MVETKVEQYVETIYEIVRKKGYAKVKDVSQVLQRGLPAVSEMFKKLSDKGYVNYERYGGVTLTEKGKKIALKLSEKHKKLEEFFILLGIDENTAKEDACKIEHVVTRETMDRITKFVDFLHHPKNHQFAKRFKKYYRLKCLSEVEQR